MSRRQKGRQDQRWLCVTPMLPMQRRHLGDGDENRGQVILCAREVDALRVAPRGSFALASALVHLGRAHARVGEHEKEREAFEEAFDVVASLEPTTDWLRGYALSRLIKWLADHGETGKAHELNERAIRLSEASHLDSSTGGRWQETHQERFLQTRAELAGPVEAETARAELAAAERRLKAASARRQPGSLGLAEALRNLAFACDRSDRTDEAARLLAESVAEARRQCGDQDWACFVAEYLVDEAKMLRRLSRDREADERTSEAIARIERAAAHFDRGGMAESAERCRAWADAVSEGRPLDRRPLDPA